MESKLKNGVKLYPHQRKTLNFLLKNPKKSKLVILPTGSGKTAVALTFANTLSQIVKTKTLIITENSLIDQMSEDYEKFYLETSNIISTKKDSKQKRLQIYKELIGEDKSILVLNYHSLANDIAEFMMVMLRIKLRGYKLNIIFDEAENLSGEGSNINKAVRELMTYANYTFGMTASPLKNYLDKTHTILQTLRIKGLPSQQEFYEKYCDIELQSIMSVNYDNKRCGYPVRATSKISDKETIIVFSLWAFIKPILSQIKRIDVKQTDNINIEAEILDANKKTLAIYTPVGYEGTVKISFETVDRNNVRGMFVISGYISVRKNVKGFRAIKDYYNSVSNYLISYSKKDIGTIPPFNMIVRNLKTTPLEKKALREVYAEYKKEVPYASETIATVCPELELWEREILPTLNTKPDSTIIQNLLKDVRGIRERKEKVILFTKYTSVAEYLGWLIEKNIKEPYGYIHGGLAGKDSVTKIKTAFNKDLNILIITESGLRGLNLQVANNTIVIDTPSSAGDLLQLAGRTARLGSKHKLLNIYMYLVKDTVTEDLYNLVFGQMRLIEEFSPDLLEQGLWDSRVAKVALDEKIDTYIRTGLKRRYELYMR